MNIPARKDSSKLQDQSMCEGFKESQGKGESGWCTGARGHCEQNEGLDLTPRAMESRNRSKESTSEFSILRSLFGLPAEDVSEARGTLHTPVGRTFEAVLLSALEAYT